MSVNKFSDQKIVDSWAKNVGPWISAIREKQIESRHLVADQAIIDAVLAVAKTNAITLDIGCGEGWLTRKLSTLGLSVLGVDVVPELVAEAKRLSKDKFEILAYEEISSKTIKHKVDLAVCNFSLLGKESVDNLFEVIPSLLNEGGHFIIQTPHPIVSCGEQEYEDAWREGSWVGFDNAFCDPAPWYFRTLESWKALFINNNFKIVEIREPKFPLNRRTASVIIIGALNVRSDI